MSRQRLYETFEKAFFQRLMTNDRSKDDLYKLLKDMKYFEKHVEYAKKIC